VLSLFVEPIKGVINLYEEFIDGFCLLKNVN